MSEFLSNGFLRNSDSNIESNENVTKCDRRNENRNIKFNLPRRNHTMTSIGKKIKEARFIKKMTQQELADLLHVSRSAISNWERERNYPDLDSIVHLSDILEVSLDQLLREDNIMVKEISNEQRKNKKRKLILRIIFPLFIISSFITGYLLYQEVSIVKNTFTPKISETITLENNLENWKDVKFDQKEYLNLTGLFWNKEIINDGNSDSNIEIRMIDIKNDKIVENFSIKPGESHKLESLKKDTDYSVEVRGEDGTYFLNLF